LASLANPLHGLLKKNAVQRWTDAQEAAKEKLVKILVSSPVLAHFDENIDIIVQTDASLVGLGAVVIQDGGEGLRPIAYASQRLNNAEIKSITQTSWNVWLLFGFYKSLDRMYTVAGSHY
jgi:hypothetical protein